MLLRRRAACLLALSFLVMLSACGFQLRGSNGNVTLPFKTLHIGISDTSSLGAELRRYVRAIGTSEIVEDPKVAEVSLQALSEQKEQAILSLNSQGRVREYSLFYRFRYRVVDAKGRELAPPSEILLKRDINFDESLALAKEQEEALLYRDMQSDLVQQLLRRLAAIQPPLSE